MTLILEAIKFNHASDSERADAINLRKNETEFIAVPEWKHGVTFLPEDSRAAYAIEETRGNTITIQAQFRIKHGPLTPLLVRAVDAKSALRSKRSCNRATLDSGALALNVLGTVKETQINFNASGETGFEIFELQDVQLWDIGVSASITSWRWQFRAPADTQWTDFAITHHRIYALLKVPQDPWQQQPYNEQNTQLPWADALEHACKWAATAMDALQAATLITHEVNDLGLGFVTYRRSTVYSEGTFDCTNFLKLLRDGRGLAQFLNCSDCATIVSSFVNLVGGDLSQSTMTGFQTNPIKVIGSQNSDTFPFTGHEVAWTGDADIGDTVFDACLHLDGDTDPTQSPFAPLLPTNLLFGTPNQDSYRFRVAAPGTTSSQCDPVSECSRRRKIGTLVTGSDECVTESQLDFISDRFKFDSWSECESENASSLNAINFRDFVVPGFGLDQPPQQRNLPNINITEGLWISPQASAGPLVRLELSECESCRAARAFLLRKLAGFEQLTLKPLENPRIGDVAFVEAAEISVLFAHDRYVGLVRSVGRQPISVVDIAHRLDQFLFSN